MCYLCRESGHFHRDCPENRHQNFVKSKHKAKPARIKSHDGGSHSDNESDEGAFGASSQSYNSGSWIVDSGASSHITQKRELLVDYEEFNKPQKVCLGDSCTVKILGRGNIHFTIIFKMSKPQKVTMHNALYVPKLACNLFSVREAAATGNTVKFGNTSCWIRDRNGKLLGICYHSLVGSLLYAAIATRPDIAQAVGAVSKFNSCPTEAHLTVVKRILRYLKGSINLGLRYKRSADDSLIGFSDVDWAGDMNDQHSTTGNLFVMSGEAISWFSRKQTVVTLPTAEAEYVGISTIT